VSILVKIVAINFIIYKQINGSYMIIIQKILA